LQRKPVAPFTPLARAVKASSEARAYASGDVGDELLMVRYQRGDRAAFASLVRRHQRGIYNFVLRQLPDATFADDVAQQVFLRAVQRSGEFKQETRFRTWLYAIARNLLQETTRRPAGRKQTDPVTQDGPTSKDEQSAQSARKSDGVTGLHERRHDRTSSPPVSEAVVSTISNLPPDQREVMLLRELGNLSFKEIAELTGTSEAAVKTRMRQALERVQQVLSDFEDYARELK
jgi:RNA polymerase sigma-70 factor (ECF subfamily)